MLMPLMPARAHANASCKMRKKLVGRARELPDALRLEAKLHPPTSTGPSWTLRYQDIQSNFVEARATPHISKQSTSAKQSSVKTLAVFLSSASCSLQIRRHGLGTHRLLPLLGIRILSNNASSLFSS